MIDYIETIIRTIPDFPKKGIQFKDITPIFLQPEAMEKITQAFVERLSPLQPTKLLAIESRGFLFGTLLAKEMNLPLALARKPGKLPSKVVRQEYELEYGTDALELHVDAVEASDKVVIIDDLLATGGTAKAASMLVEQCGGRAIAAAFVIELAFLQGAEKLDGMEIVSLASYK